MNALARLITRVRDEPAPISFTPIDVQATPLGRLIARLGFKVVRGVGRLGRADLRNYQDVTVDLIKTIWQPGGPPGLILAYDMGSGKTVSTLTALRDLLDEGVIKRPLVIAPLLVAETVWPDEIEEWDHLAHTTYSVITGDPKRRLAAMESKAEIHIINKENVPWAWEASGRGARWPYDVIVIDEASMLKNGKKRTKLKKLTRFGALAQARKHTTGVIELTGTPAPNGLQNLWGLSYIVDGGERLGRDKGGPEGFLSRWFDVNQYTFETKAKPHAEREIMARLQDIMFSLDPRDYAELPPFMPNPIKVKLPPKVMDEYRRFKRTLVSEMYDVEAVNAGVLTNKLLQFANGSMYQEDGNDIFVHDLKLDALENLHDEANGTPLLVAYSFRFDLARIKKRFPKAVVLNESKDVRRTKNMWNAGEIDMLLAHPLSAGHGLNIQKGSNTSVWYGLTADLELFQQFNKRLWRSGQTADIVWNHRIIAEGTHDEAILPILDAKDAVQSRVIEATRIDLSTYRT